MTTRARFLALLLSIGLVAPAAELPAQQKDRVTPDQARQALQGFDRFVDSAMTAWKVVGLGLGIVVDGQVVYEKGHGLRDLEKKLPATPKTMFAIGSSSKAFTVFALGTLVDQGKLEWDSARMKFTNSAEANQHIKPKFRKGWQAG